MSHPPRSCTVIVPCRYGVPKLFVRSTSLRDFQLGVLVFEYFVVKNNNRKTKIRSIQKSSVSVYIVKPVSYRTNLLLVYNTGRCRLFGNLFGKTGRKIVEILTALARVVGTGRAIWARRRVKVGASPFRGVHALDRVDTKLDRTGSSTPAPELYVA